MRGSIRDGRWPVRARTAFPVALMLVATTAGQVRVAASEVPQVAITSPADGAIVQDIQSLSATAGEGVVEVSFSWSKDGTNWNPISTDATPADGWTAEWETGSYSGPAWVKALATDGTLIGKDVVSTKVDNTKVDNVPPKVQLSTTHRSFSPGHDHSKDATEVTLTSSERADLKIVLFGLSGRVRQRWTASNSRKLSIRWTGGTRRSYVWDGRYKFKGVAVDGGGSTGRARRHVLVDTRAPHISWHGGPHTIDGLARAPFDYSMHDASGRAKLRFDIWDHTGWVDKTAWIRRGTGAGEMTWNPGYQQIGRPLTPGRYRTRITAVDAAGNERYSTVRKLRIQRSVHASVYRRVEGAGQRVALTFDDCLFEDAWSSILTTLHDYHVKATFFCPGQYVYLHSALARRTVREGHSVGSHGWDHAALAGRGASETMWRLQRDSQAWWSVGDAAAPFFRPPYGSTDSSVVQGAGAASYSRVVLWDVDTNDWRGRSPSQIASTVVGSSRGGSIVLMHVLRNTADALPSILHGLKARGLKPVSLHRLFAAGGLR